MFTDEELLNKKMAFEISKIRFEKMSDFFNGKIKNFKDYSYNYSSILITIARFITFKEDIWKKNKKTKDISTNFSREILDDFIFKGKFISSKIDVKQIRRRVRHSFDPVKINKILKGKENDSVWIIDNIRDSIAHGHFYINFDEKTVVIKNIHPDRLFECSINFACFFLLSELITEERIGGYTDKKLTVPPISHIRFDEDYPSLKDIKSEQELRVLLERYLSFTYSDVTEYYEEDLEQRYHDLTSFFNYNIRIREQMIKCSETECNLDKYYTQKISAYTKTNMSKYKVNIYNRHLNDKEIHEVILLVREHPEFYERCMDDQKLILLEIIQFYLTGENLTVERGVFDIEELYNIVFLKSTTTDSNNMKRLHDLMFGNVNTFIENKKLANLFIMAINNFVSNKESIYDKYFTDYNEFDISKFSYKDYSGYQKLISKIKVMNSDLAILNNNLKKLEKSLENTNSNYEKAPDKRKVIILKNINEIKDTISDTKNKISKLIEEINKVSNEIDNAKCDKYGKYISSSNKEFFTHLRNALAHNHIRYADDRLIYNRDLILEDYDDDNNLSFVCECKYYTLAKLLNNELFLEALSKKSPTKKI